MMWSIDLSWTKLPLTQNRREHYQAVGRKRRDIKDEIIVRARSNKLPKLLQQGHVELHWRPAVGRQRDTDNPAPSLKAVIDGLVAYGIFEDDNSEIVSSETVIHPPVKGKNVFWVTIVDQKRHVS